MRKPPKFAGILALASMFISLYDKNKDTFVPSPGDLGFHGSGLSGHGSSGYFKAITTPGKLQKSRSRMFKRSRIDSRGDAKN